jgi:uncharacterized membrane protein
MQQFDTRVIAALVGTSLLAAVLLAAGMITTGSLKTYYLATNLLLGYVPLLLNLLLAAAVAREGWVKLGSWLWLGLWLLFLPNSFYLVTDFSHLFDRFYGLDPMFAVVLFGLFGVVGVAIGLESVSLVQRLVARRVGGRLAYFLAELAFLLSSIAIYYGHVLRLNSWDVVLHPLEVIQDVCNAFMNLNGTDATLILTFFVLLSGLHAVLWHAVFGKIRIWKKLIF